MGLGRDLLDRWGLSGLRAERVDLVSARSPEEVEARLQARTRLGPATLAMATRREAGRYRTRDGGYRLSIWSYKRTVAGVARFAYVRLLPEGAGTRIVGEIRPRRSMFVFWSTAQVASLLVVVALALAWSPRVWVALFVAFWVQCYSRFLVVENEDLLRLLADVAS